jgi:precorrin-3B synthase
MPTVPTARAAPASLDACPGILTLHPARDGHVARIRLPGGYVSRAQWSGLATLATEFGDGCLDLTARGNVQLRGLAATAGEDLARRAVRAGLLPSGAHDRSRNVTASPLAGLGGRPPLRRLVRALDTAIVADPVLAALPGRFLFAADDGTGGAGLAVSDVGIRRDGRHAEVAVAGRLTGVRLPLGQAVTAVVTAARAAVGCGVGSLVTRIADLADGGAAVAAAIGGMLGPPAVAREGRLSLGTSDQAGCAVLIVAAPLGRLNSTQARLLGAMLRPGEVLRLATAGRLVIPLGVTPPQLARTELIISDGHDLAGVTACSGMACRRAVADVRAAARPLPGHPRTHWAACPRGCGRPPDADLVVATGPDSFAVSCECPVGAHPAAAQFHSSSGLAAEWPDGQPAGVS